MANIPGTTAGEPLDGTADADVINADAGDDTLNGLEGDDELFGEGDNDIITGGTGTDMLYGGDGDDILVYDEVTPAEEFDGGSGNDTLELQLGGPLDFATLISIEHLLFAPTNPLIPLTARISIEHLNSAGITTLTGSAAADQLVLLLQTAGSYTMPNFTLNSWDAPTTLNVGDGGDALVLFGSDTGDYTLTAREGLAATQILVGNTGNDVLTGSSGVDFLGSGGGIDMLDAGGGNDVLSLINRLTPSVQYNFSTSFTGAGSTFEGGTGTDMLLIGSYVNFQGTLSGIEGIGLDTGLNPAAINFGETAVLEMDLAHYAMLPSNFFVSGAGAVVVQLDEAGVHDFSGVTFTSNSGDGTRSFRFVGETGGTATPLAIAIGGTSRDDVFYFGHDSYLATGGDGTNEYGFLATHWGQYDTDVTITDFTPGDDYIDLATTSITSLDRLLGIATQQGADVVISTQVLGSSFNLVLEDVTLASLQASDFNFGVYLYDQRSDFNGDHLSDILWRNADGFVSTWAASGNAIAPTTGLNFVGLDWHAATVGDFNSDGVDDILWRNDTGAVTYWEGSSSGAFDHDTGFFTYAEAGWNIAGSGDYNGDGYDDILWQNADGGVTWWDSDGTVFIASSAYATVGAGWSVAGTGDFDGDAKADDVLWRNVDGGVTLWTGNGSGFDASSFYATVSADWEVAGIGDFNGDDEDDVLWRNDNGALTFWAGTLTGFDADTGVLDFADTAWEVADIGDYNGDGADDILWQHSDGRVTWWLGNGTGFDASGTTYANAPADWDIIDL